MIDTEEKGKGFYSKYKTVILSSFITADVGIIIGVPIYFFGNQVIKCNYLHS